VFVQVNAVFRKPLSITPGTVHACTLGSP
jgi:hypothetical protein